MGVAFGMNLESSLEEVRMYYFNNLEGFFLIFWRSIKMDFKKSSHVYSPSEIKYSNSFKTQAVLVDPVLT